MACPTTPKKILLRRDTATNWSLINPILEQGEIGIEIDTNSVKIGNGISNWNALGYFTGNTGPTGPTGPRGQDASGIFDGGSPSSTYAGQPAIDFGGVV